MARLEEWPAESRWVAHFSVSPAEAGVPLSAGTIGIPAFAGMTEERSVTLELRDALVRKSFVSAVEIAGLHAARLRFRFHLKRFFDADVPFGVELLLGDRVRDVRAARQIARERLRVGEHIVADAVPEPP